MKKKILIVISNYYEEIGKNLLKGSTAELKINKIDFDILYAPGCFEIPFLISKNINDTILKSYLSNHKLKNKIKFINEKKQLGTAGSLFLTKKEFTKNILVINCDVILDIDFRDLINFHEVNKNDATIVVTEIKKENKLNLTYEIIDFSKNIIHQICDLLCEHKVQSIIVEGGTKTLQKFINHNLWDEARVFRGTAFFDEGTKAPSIKGQKISETKIEQDFLKILLNDKNPPN